jgi:hypothetical protein
MTREKYRAALIPFHKKDIAHNDLKDGHILMNIAKNRVNIIGLSRCVALSTAANINANLKVVDARKLDKYKKKELDAMDSTFNLQPSQVPEESEGEEEGVTDAAEWIEAKCDPMEPAW